MPEAGGADGANHAALDQDEQRVASARPPRLETEAGGGKLMLTRWRAGKTDEVMLKLPVLGSYSPTAPFDCPKSKRILEQGCKAIAARMGASDYANQDPIPRSLNALALLASGDAAYLPLIKKEAEWAAAYSSDSMQTWHYGYVMMLLGEYVAATGDQSVMPGLKRLALESAKGQSAVGSWGHGFAKPDGRLGGYGMMNSPGVPLTISLVLAHQVGQEVDSVETGHLVGMMFSQALAGFTPASSRASPARAAAAAASPPPPWPRATPRAVSPPCRRASTSPAARRARRPAAGRGGA